ncbi:hypothetical protein [Streptomyces sp. CA-111067]|uniref:hypothetical protein n=1 Tax=Streptomyces sp. CA-111067 TaxID=3240046 RepID=UPI003D9679CF
MNTMRSIKLSKPVVACGALAVVAAAVMGGVAVADDSAIKTKAPHAQAAAFVNTDGTRLHSKGIKSLTHPQTGVYCVAFDADTGIVVNRSTPVATLHAIPGTSPWGWTVYATTTPTSLCGDGELTMYTGSNSGPVDHPFYLVMT